MTDMEAIDFVTRFPQIRDCYRVTGNALLVLLVRVPDNDGLKALLADLYKQGETRTSVVLHTEIDRRPIFASADDHDPRD